MTEKNRAVDETDFFKPIGMDEGILSNRAAQRIRELVRSGELREGDRLPSERELSDRLGVSRTVVREAIKLLKAEGLVQVRLGVGTFITEPSPNILEAPLSYLGGPTSKKIQDLQQVRSLLEPAIATLAAQSATPEDIARIEKAVQDMDVNIDHPLKYIEADNAFHLALAEATKNSVLQLLVYSLVDLLQAGRQFAISSPGAAKRSNRYHHKILEAVRQGDAEKASQVMAEHMEQTATDMWNGMKRWAKKQNILE